MPTPKIITVEPKKKKTKKKIARKKAKKKNVAKKKTTKKKTRKKKTEKNVTRKNLIPPRNDPEIINSIFEHLDVPEILYVNGYGKPKTGRPSRPIETAKVLELAKIGCTNLEIAAVLGMDKDVWNTAKKNNPILDKIVSIGKQHGNASLRRKQMQIALQGNTQMLIWLGKNKLKQSDKTMQHIEFSQGETFKDALNESDEDDG